MSHVRVQNTVRYKAIFILHCCDNPTTGCSTSLIAEINRKYVAVWNSTNNSENENCIDLKKRKQDQYIELIGSRDNLPRSMSTQHDVGVRE